MKKGVRDILFGTKRDWLPGTNHVIQVYMFLVFKPFFKLQSNNRKKIESYK